MSEKKSAISAFEVFKIGIGPSSSHTMGPMVAAFDFAKRCQSMVELPAGARIEVRLLGSLAFTGKGHATDRAVLLGLMEYLPERNDFSNADAEIADLLQRKLLQWGSKKVRFDPAEDIIFDYNTQADRHPNTVIFSAISSDQNLLLEQSYFSVGGGFVETEEQGRTVALHRRPEPKIQPPYPYGSAADLLAIGRARRMSIADIQYQNELSWHSSDEIRSLLDALWKTMDACIENGLSQAGRLPGGLNVQRRAFQIHQQLSASPVGEKPHPHVVNDWIALFALAVNEENAAGGRVVTSPTNGAAGVVPAVFKYYLNFIAGAEVERFATYIFTAAAVGGIIKRRASISGAECGCQAEVGSASAMAAAGMCALLGGTNSHIENAAEIALEHHLGLTCDPLKGLVQVPCIERNGIAAIKAVSAASMAMRGDGTHVMPLDNCIEAMRQTGEDMQSKYKETSLGGLAVNAPNC